MADQGLVRFLVLANARTGSYMLVQALNSHSAITCFSELFQWKLDYVDFNVAGYDNNDPEARCLRDRDFRSFLSERVFAGHPDGTRAAGFKLLYGHVWGTEGLLEYLVEDVDLRIVHLKRRNRLRMLVSTLIAERTGVWQVDQGFSPVQLRDPALWRRAIRRPVHAGAALRRWLAHRRHSEGKEPLVITPDMCRTFFIRSAHEEEHFATLFASHPIHDVYYEDIVADREVTLRDVQSFLGVQPAPSVVTLRKQNPEPLRELIANYDDLYREYRNTSIEAFFD